jgi:DNA-directed RNA polymerase specialized sigma subunit
MREDLILSHVNLTKYIAARVCKPGSAMARQIGAWSDVIQVATLALCRAADKWDGVRSFVNLLWSCIRFAIYRAAQIEGLLHTPRGMMYRQCYTLTAKAARSLPARTEDVDARIDLHSALAAMDEEDRERLNRWAMDESDRERGEANRTTEKKEKWARYKALRHLRKRLR